MALFTVKVRKTRAGNILMVVALGPNATLKSVTVQNLTTPYRVMPIYVGPIPQDLTASIDQGYCLPLFKGSWMQDSQRNAIGWQGEFLTSAQQPAVIVDVTSCNAGDDVIVSVGYE